MFVFCLIWSEICVPKWYFLEELIRIYCLEIWIYLIRILLKALSFNTIVYQTSLFDKIVYQNRSICVTHCWIRVFVSTIIPYAICLWGDHNISHLARECLVRVHLGPVHQESVHEHLLAVRSSGPDIHVHDFVQWSNNFIFDIKWISFDLKLLFESLPSNLFGHVLKCIILEVG